VKTLFIPCTFDGLRNPGSARVRAEWVARYWDGAEVYDRSQPLAGCDLYVFQKAYLTSEPRMWIAAAARWRDGGACRLAFDLCDPDFLEEEHRRRMLDVLPLFDFAVAPTEALAEWLGRYLPARVIPDRVDVEEVRGYGRARLTDSDTPTCVWAGYERNVAALDALRPMVEEMGLPLVVLALDGPLPFGEFWRRVLGTGEVLLNPRPEDGRLSYKSDNKTVIAWTLGMPVARTVDELRRLADPTERSNSAKRSALIAETVADVRLSVKQWHGIVAPYFGEGR
jgi:hypothetical protein